MHSLSLSLSLDVHIQFCILLCGWSKSTGIWQFGDGSTLCHPHGHTGLDQEICLPTSANISAYDQYPSLPNICPNNIKYVLKCLLKCLFNYSWNCAHMFVFSLISRLQISIYWAVFKTPVYGGFHGVVLSRSIEYTWDYHNPLWEPVLNQPGRKNLGL